MKKMTLLRSALAAGMASALVLTPVSASAETFDETEFAALQEEMGDSFEEFTASASEAALFVEFGDAFYNLGIQDGTDLTWLENVSAYGKIVPGEETLDAQFVAGMNDSVLCSLLVSYDYASGLICISIPELFDQAICVSFLSFSSFCFCSSLTSSLTFFHGLFGSGSVGSQSLHSTLSDIFLVPGFPRGPGSLLA